MKLINLKMGDNEDHTKNKRIISIQNKLKSANFPYASSNKFTYFIFFILIILSLFDTTNSVNINNKNKNKIKNRNRSKNKSKLNSIAKQLKPNSEDNASWSQSDSAVQTKLDFDVYVDMNKRLISGFVRFHYKCLKPNVNFLALDVNNLFIKKIINSDKKELDFKIKNNTENSIGDALLIYAEDMCQKKDKANSFVDIHYHTMPKSMGLHFSNPETLHDKRYTFLYTHGEAIYGRTFFPSQDTPSLKVPLTARILIDDPYTAMFSGKLVSRKKLKDQKKTEFYFEMEQPIPTYLVTFVAGNLVKKSIENSRCEVYGEEESLKYVNESFKYCEKYLKFYEKYGKFFLEKMVFLVTPDDFPFSGMENPFATIISESVLSKDRSYTSTISHEIAHFWSGNLVTNKNWKSFWLNEGITTYLTRKSFKKIHGQDQFAFEMYNGLFKLDNAIDDLKRNGKIDETQRSLNPVISEDPYKSFSRIPYEKGSFFMYYIETLLGEELMDKFLSDYFKEFAFKSLDSLQFIEFMKSNIKSLVANKTHSNNSNSCNGNSTNFLSAEEIIQKVEWDKWLNGTEKLPVQFNFESAMLFSFKEKVELIKKGDLSHEEFKKMLKPMRLIEKGRIFKELIDKFAKLNEKTKTLLKEIIKNDVIFDTHKSNQSDKILLKALFMNEAEERIKYLKKTLIEFPFYKVLHLKKVFGLINEKKNDKKLLFSILNSIADRLNPVAYARITELIQSKTKNQ